MSYDLNNPVGARTWAADRGVYDEGLRQHMLRVYNYMSGGLVVTGVVALFVASSPALLQTIFGTPLRWVVMLSPFAFILALSFGINRMSAMAARMTFLAYSATMGLSLSSIFLVYRLGSIGEVFFITAGTFAATSLWGYTTKKDLSGFGSFLFMGLIGIIIASIVNMFIGSGPLQYGISILAVLIFTGLTAYDTQSIKQTYSEGWGVEANGKLAVMGALRLYLDFVNLFLQLLRLMGDRR